MQQYFPTLQHPFNAWPLVCSIRAEVRFCENTDGEGIRECIVLAKLIGGKFMRRWREVKGGGCVCEGVVGETFEGCLECPIRY